MGVAAQGPGDQSPSAPRQDGTTPNFIPHPDNVREQDSVVEAYAERIAVDGIATDCRGKAFAIESSTPNGKPLKLITWGTLSRGAYLNFADPETKDLDPVQFKFYAG